MSFRFFISFITLFSVLLSADFSWGNPNCQGNQVRQTLGFLASSRSGNQGPIPPSQHIRISGVDTANPSRCLIWWRDQRRSVNAEDLRQHSEPVRVSLHRRSTEYLEHGVTMARPYCRACEEERRRGESRCPQGSELRDQNWNAASASRLILNCQEQPVQFVRRNNLSARGCRVDTTQVFTRNSQQWNACPAPPECTPEAGRNNSLAEQNSRLRTERMHCHRENRLRPLGPNDARATSCMTPFERPPSRILVHHTAMAPHQGVAHVQRLHQESNRWADMGYHFMIAPTADGSWRVFEGRNINHQGAHAGAGLNADSLAIVIAGNYAASPSPGNPSADRPMPPPEAVRELLNLVRHLKDRYPSIRQIGGHGETRYHGLRCSRDDHCPNGTCQTECPSPGCMHLVNRLNERYFPLTADGGS